MMSPPFGTDAAGAHRPASRSAHDPVQRLNDQHADDLVLLARTFGEHPDAISASAERVDRDGIELRVTRPGAVATVHVAFAEPITDDGATTVRVAFRRLVKRARAASPHAPTPPSAG